MRYKNKNAKTGLQGTARRAEPCRSNQGYTQTLDNTLGVPDSSVFRGTSVCNDIRTQ